MIIINKIIPSVLIIALVIVPARSHEGMIALYADESASSCQAILPELTIINLSLFYVRGDGPQLGRCVEFRLLKSNDDLQIGFPIWDESFGLVMTMGSLESGIMICYHYGEGFWCFEGDYVFLGTIPVVNISDPDTFTVSVVEDPNLVSDPAILIVECAPMYPEHEVIGGTFVFNATCYSPENPFQSPTRVERSNWGAIKSLFKK